MCLQVEPVVLAGFHISSQQRASCTPSPPLPTTAPRDPSFPQNSYLTVGIEFLHVFLVSWTFVAVHRLRFRFHSLSPICVLCSLTSRLDSNALTHFPEYNVGHSRFANSFSQQQQHR